VCDEIDENYSKMQETALNEQFNRMRNIWTKNIANSNQNEWVGFGKRISIWILSDKVDTTGTDYYRYLSNNELKNFIRQGFYGFIREIEENLTLYYLDCETFSVNEQNIEKLLLRERTSANFPALSDIEKNELFERRIHEIESLTLVYRSSLLIKYNNIHPYFKKNFVYAMKLYLLENFLIKNWRKSMSTIIKKAPKWGILSWIRFGLNCVIIIAGFILAGYVGGTVILADPRLGLQFLGIGFGLIGLGWSLISSQFNEMNMSEMKQMLIDIKNKP